MYAIVLVMALVVSEIYITSVVRENHIEELRKTLSTQIDIISDRIAFGKENIDELCVELKKKTGARVTVILPDGRVIGDSDTPSGKMENHLQRTEIAQSRFHGSGNLIRHSETVNVDFLYLAKRIMLRAEVVGFIRLAVPLTDIDRAVSSLRINVSIILVVALLIMWLFVLYQTDQLRRLIARLSDLSSSLAGGEIDKCLLMDKGGEFGEIASNLVDMSERLRGLLASSEEERNRLNVILKSIPDPLLIIDTKGNIALSNAAADSFFSDGPLNGRHYLEAVRSDAFSCLVEHVRSTGEPGSAKIRLETPIERHFNAFVSPFLYNESSLAGFVIIFHDITKIEKLEEMRKDFVANISHEIRTPITAIKGFSDTLLDGAINDRENATRFLEAIRQNSERINNLVSDLLTLSQIELGVTEVAKTKVDLGDILDQVAAMLKEKAAGKELYLEKVVGENLREIEADRDRLIQIFTNLVDNAIKFTETGGVRFGSGLENGKSYLFVEDTGIGVPPKHVPRLGERFYRVDSARSRKMGGTGLGLAIVKHLIKAHGWDMKIESEPGSGTVVKIYL